MPAKDSKLISGDRKTTITVKSFNAFKKKHPGLVADYKQYREIIETVNEIKAEFILNPTGYKVEYGGSVIIVNRYKSDKLLCDYNKTRLLGKYVPYNNDHCFNYKHTIKWYSSFDRLKNFRLMMFFPARKVKRTLAENIKESKVLYHNWVKSDFYSVKHLEQLLN